MMMISFLQNDDRKRSCQHRSKRYVRILRRITIVRRTRAHVLFTAKSGSMITFIEVVCIVPATSPDDPVFVRFQSVDLRLDCLYDLPANGIFFSIFFCHAYIQF